MLIHPKWFKCFQGIEDIDENYLYHMAFGDRKVRIGRYMKLTDLNEHVGILRDIRKNFISEYLKYWGQGTFLPTLVVPYDNQYGYLFNYPYRTRRLGGEIEIETHEHHPRNIVKVPLSPSLGLLSVEVKTADRILIDYYRGVPIRGMSNREMSNREKSSSKQIGIEGFFKGVASLELSSPLSLKLIEGYCKKNNVKYSQLENLMGLLEKTEGEGDDESYSNME